MCKSDESGPVAGKGQEPDDGIGDDANGATQAVPISRKAKVVKNKPKRTEATAHEGEVDPETGTNDDGLVYSGSAESVEALDDDAVKIVEPPASASSRVSAVVAAKYGTSEEAPWACPRCAKEYQKFPAFKVRAAIIAFA